MKNRKRRVFFARLISKMPTNSFRCFLYRTLLGYNIYKSKIGRGTVIVVENANLIECKIGRFNTFIGPMHIIINQNASLGPGNMIQADSVEPKHDYLCTFLMGENSRIGRNHHIDVAASFTLGKNSWIAGKSSQFWTHGAGLEESILIGENCYIGSAVLFTPGSSLGDNTLVALGSVITKKFNSNNIMIGGNPAKIIKENYDWKTQKSI